MEGRVKIWDGRMWGKEVRSWAVRNSPTSLSYSGRGMLAVGGKSGVTVYRDLTSSTLSESSLSKLPQPYLNLPLPALTASSTKFCPYDDLLCIGHQRGISSLLVPGSGEANFDSAEADVFETYTRRRERDVRGVMEKIRPELITMDTGLLGTIREDKGPETFAEREARSFRQLGRMERLRKEGQLGEGLGGDTSVAAAGDESSDEDEEGGDGKVASGERADKGKKKMRYVDTRLFSRPFLSFRANAR
jgi:U3 small nucleolar RNA-associated protein 7